jgi:hypothetical protein
MLHIVVVLVEQVGLVQDLILAVLLVVREMAEQQRQQHNRQQIQEQ